MATGFVSDDPQTGKQMSSHLALWTLLHGFLSKATFENVCNNVMMSNQDLTSGKLYLMGWKQLKTSGFFTIYHV